MPRIAATSTVLCCLGLALSSCGEGESSAAGRSGASLVHLDEQLADAVVETTSPAAAAAAREWSFDAPRPEWRAVDPEEFEGARAVRIESADDALRLALPPGFGVGGIVADVGELRLEDWETAIVRARASDRFAGITVLCNLEPGDRVPDPGEFFGFSDGTSPVFNDGSVQSYALPLRLRKGDGEGATLRSLSVLVAGMGGPRIDILSVSLLPRGAAFPEEFGARSVSRSGTCYHTMFAHAPATLTFPAVPAGRLDSALTVNRGDTVTYRVHLERGGKRTQLFEETIEDPELWQQRSVSLAAGPSGAHLVLEAVGERDGAVALWGSPIVSVEGPSERPNVIFYVIDGGDADLMSLYGYGRPTTPFLEKLAREGVLFTRAYSNSTWTQPSTASFMTSLQHSVLGGLRRGVHSTAVPEGAVTMADHFRRGGYQTASFTANPNAGRIIGIDQGVDVMRDHETENHSTSSVDLQELFFEFRRDYPGKPYWVHFQTTDVHEPNHPTEPFAGRYVTPEERQQLEEWTGKIWETSGQYFGTTSIVAFYDQALERAGIDRKGYFGTRRGLYDETMNHQDQALEQFVARLRREGEWENTILVIGADHGHPAGTFARFGRGELDPQPEPWQGALCDAYATRVPLLIVWPARIQGGREVDQPVSMIDVLPTLLDLAGLPPPEILQGHSLAPLLRGQDVEVPPVILDEFRVDEESGEMIGNLEVIDGRWGASLEIGPVPDGADPGRGRRSVPAGGRWGTVHPFFPDVPRLLLYDLEKDPFATRAVNDEHPELVKKYTEFLRAQWQAHRLLARRFSDAGEVPMTPGQLEQLRALGYIR